MEALSRLPDRLRARLRRAVWLSLLCLAFSATLSAQFIGTVMGGTSFDQGRFVSGNASAMARFGFGFAHARDSHVMAAWNIFGFGYDQLQHRGGGNIETSMMGILSLARGTTHSNSPLLIGEAGTGYRFGGGPLGGYTELGAGVGWDIGSHIPFIEFRRRFPFGAAQADNQIVVGIHFVLFD